ncbi:hypothetical protein D4R86_04560 [bacterium]|nr:MAG: hypothetical protein D4R86_04560 [bacterium]
MAIPLIERIANCILKNGGTEIHVAMDDERIYCEGETFAVNLANILAEKFRINTLVGKETEIPNNVNELIKVFPVSIGNPKNNHLVIRTKDMVLAIGIGGILQNPKIHHRGIKVMPITNGRRRSGRRNHSTTK